MSDLSPRGLLRALTAGDIVVCVAVLLASGVLAGIAGRSATGATHAVVTVGRDEVAVIALASPGVTTVDGRTGPLTLAVHDGAVRVSESDCPHRICVAMGEKRLTGEVIACVPNAVLVRLVGGAPDPSVPDAVTR
jgi:hypothetical protein